MQRGKTTTLMLISILVLTLTAACHHKTVVTNLPTGVTSSQVMNWYTAVGISKTVAQTSSDLTSALINLNHAGLFPDGNAYASTLASVGKIARAGQKADAQLAQLPQTWGQSQKQIIFDLLQSVTAELQNADTMTIAGIKDAQSQAEVRVFLTTLKTAIATAQQLVQ